jgi:AcrR family transcriptional regulator
VHNEGSRAGYGVHRGRPLSKEERYSRVADAVAALLLRGGLDAVRFATVARRAGVSRAWLYKYFGTEPTDLAVYTIRAWGAQFTELETARPAPDPATWRQNVAIGTRQGLSDAVRAPWVMELLVRHQAAPGVLGDEMRTVEGRHLDRFVGDMPLSLKGDAVAARRFAALFAAARVGTFHRWLDPAWRAQLDADEVVEGLMSMVDAFIHRSGR